MSALAGTIGAVVRGRNCRLFLGRQDGFDLGRFIDGSALPPFLLEQWRATLLRRGREFSERGIPYLFVVAPDAPSVHYEDLPDQYPAPYRMAGSVFMEAMGTIPGVTFVHPVDVLRAARGGIDVYQRNDSHWTSYGSGVAYRALMSKILPLRAAHVVSSSEVRFTHRLSYGDLGSLCDPELCAEIPVAVFSGPEPERLLDRSGAQRQTTTATRMQGAPAGRVLAFRDSFMTDLSPYLARSFSDLLTVGTTTRVMLDAVDEWRPDLVISEVAERRLIAFQTDHQPHRYKWMYMTDYSGEHGQAVLRALNLMTEDLAAAAAIVRNEGDSCLLDPSHAYSAAVILEAAGDPSAASKFVQSVIESNPHDVAALALASKLVLGAGRAGEAVSFLERAVEAAPWNGAYQELLVYALIQDGRPVQASVAAETALSRIEDHANLWYWASILREASGHVATALEAVSHALVLDPSNGVYLDLSRRLGGQSSLSNPHRT